MPTDILREYEYQFERMSTSHPYLYIYMCFSNEKFKKMKIRISNKIRIFK